MGGTTYSYASATTSRATKGTYTNSIDANFTQNRKRMAHESMKSQGIILREARDSEVHPETFPILLGLDLTGSMQDIPQNLIQTGLPDLISGLIQGGLQSPALLFVGVGDHECDREPLQVGQFESGDVELDMWLGRTYLEGGGGGNAGESYSLAHYFASRHVVTDAWEKRKQKGVLITIGDEPNLKNYPSSAMKEIMNNGDIKTFSDSEILAEALERWEVFHINPRANSWRGDGTADYWKQLLGDRYIEVENYTQIPDVVKGLVLKLANKTAPNIPDSTGERTTPSTDTDKPVML